MRKQFSRLLLMIVSVISISACNSEKEKIRYEITSSAPIQLDIRYINGERNQVDEKFNGSQWSYEGEISFLNDKFGHQFRLSCDGKGPTQHSVTLKIYRGQKLLVEETVQSKEPMHHDPTTFRSSGGVDSYIEP